MTLDIDLLRVEKGGDPDKVRENQRRRFADVQLVDRVVQSDEEWRKGNLINGWKFNPLSSYPSL